jgi:hypothetical protein
MYKRLTLKTEDGSILVVTLAMLVILTLLAMAATKTSESELLVAGNEKMRKKSYYLAEGAALECAQQLKDTNSDTLKSFGWLHGRLQNTSISNAANWTDEHSSETFDRARYLVLDTGPSSGQSLVMTVPVIHELTIYGRSATGRVESVVQIGYRRKL